MLDTERQKTHTGVFFFTNNLSPPIRDGSVLTDLEQMGACNQGKEGFEILIAESSLVDTRSATGESVLTTLFVSLKVRKLPDEG